ncbi:hypothetical protein LTR53_004814 [Teratosphaeriaceae sp. CCFEE 6253]|nr:hypothetical protein LTR53_004814 [Teratosphaeriaceae sp. CCFEE 6253]
MDQEIFEQLLNSGGDNGGPAPTQPQHQSGHGPSPSYGPAGPAPPGLGGNGFQPGPAGPSNNNGGDLQSLQQRYNQLAQEWSDDIPTAPMALQSKRMRIARSGGDESVILTKMIAWLEKDLAKMAAEDAADMAAMDGFGGGMPFGPPFGGGWGPGYGFGDMGYGGRGFGPFGGGFGGYGGYGL